MSLISSKISAYLIFLKSYAPWKHQLLQEIELYFLSSLRFSTIFVKSFIEQTKIFLFRDCPNITSLSSIPVFSFTWHKLTATLSVSKYNKTSHKYLIHDTVKEL